MEKEKALDIDYILDNYVGGGNRWQLLTLMTIAPTAWASAYPLFMHIFAAYEPSHRCFVPSCDIDPISGLLNESHTDFTIPKEHLYTNIFSENEKLDPCRRFKSKFEGEDYDCLPENFYDNETVPCDAYIYSREIFTNTLTTDIDLVRSPLGKPWLQTLTSLHQKPFVAEKQKLMKMNKALK
jgi:hypothetical protein